MIALFFSIYYFFFLSASSLSPILCTTYLIFFSLVYVRSTCPFNFITPLPKIILPVLVTVVLFFPVISLHYFKPSIMRVSFSGLYCIVLRRFWSPLASHIQYSSLLAENIKFSRVVDNAHNVNGPRKRTTIIPDFSETVNRHIKCSFLH